MKNKTIHTYNFFFNLGAAAIPSYEKYRKLKGTCKAYRQLTIKRDLRDDQYRYYNHYHYQPVLCIFLFIFIYMNNPNAKNVFVAYLS